MNRYTALNLNNIILKIRHDNVINLMMKITGRIIFKTTFQCPHDAIVRLNIDSCPVFISQKVEEDLKHKEIKSVLINKQSVVYKFEDGWCDASYVQVTCVDISANESMSRKDLDQYQ